MGGGFDAQQIFDMIKQRVNDNPVPTLLACLGAGFVLGGGLKSPFIRRILLGGLGVAASAVVRHYVQSADLFGGSQQHVQGGDVGKSVLGSSASI